MSRNTELALRVATIVWAAITLIHFTIWALVSIIGGGIDQPWWLYVALPPGLVLGLFWLARLRDQ